MRIATTLLALSLVACAGVMPAAQSATLVPGLYRFYENPSGVASTIEGTMRVFADSIDLVDATPPCIKDRRPIRTQTPFFSFNCVTYAITADRSSGRWNISYSTTKRVETVTEKCVYTTTPDGKVVCSSKQQDREERDVPVRGLLRLTPVDSGAAR